MGRVKLVTLLQQRAAYGRDWPARPLRAQRTSRPTARLLPRALGVVMLEPPHIRAARQHLAQAESGYQSEDGLFHLEEGLALLDEMMACDAPAHRTIAHNLALTYATKILRTVRRLVETDRGLPEPVLEHLFKVVLAFDDRGFELPVEARAAKITVVERLIDRYYEGHSPEQKRAALEELAKISGRPR